MIRPSAYRPLYDRGVRVLSGYFIPDGKSGYDINYRMDNTRSAYLSKHDVLVDFDSGIVFSRVDVVCNETPIEQIVPTLSPLTQKLDRDGKPIKEVICLPVKDPFHLPRALIYCLEVLDRIIASPTLLARSRPIRPGRARDRCRLSHIQTKRCP